MATTGLNINAVSFEDTLQLLRQLQEMPCNGVIQSTLKTTAQLTQLGLQLQLTVELHKTYVENKL